MKKLFKILGLFIFTICISLFTNTALAATTSMPTSSYTKFKNSVTKFAFNHGRLEQNEADYIKITNNKINYYKDADGYIYFYADVNNYAAVEYNPSTGNDYLVRLYFKNCGNIGGKSVDAYVDVTRLKLSKYWTGGTFKPSNKKAIFLQVKGGVWIGNQYDTDATAYKYSADQEIDVKVTMMWSDTGETVDLPFFTMQTDIDTYKNTSSTDKTIEGWKAGSGYTNNFYTYSGTSLTQSSGKWIRKSTAAATSGDDEYLKTGVYATTSSGSFTSTYYEGVCATALMVTSQYINGDNALTPVKTSKITAKDGTTKDKVTALSDKITYNVKQTFGTQYVNTFDPYKSMSIKDVLPSELKYESAVVTVTSGSSTTDITNNSAYGTLSYDNSSHTLTYTFNETYLSTFANYQGQVFNIAISTSVIDATGDYVNKATTYIDNASFDSNEVTDTYAKKSPTYKYVSGTEGVSLPSEISTSTGDYKIGDDTLYLNDVDVNRKNTVPTGTKYNIYYNDKLTATWELVNWDKDKDTMTDSGVEFTGTWQLTTFVDPEKPVKTSTIKNSNGEEKEKVDSINDKIVYEISQTLGVGNKTIFKPYSSMSIKDVIPAGLKYESATVTMKNGSTSTNITTNTTIGTLSYDNNTKTLSYTFNSNWLKNLSNFEGQTIIITINTSIESTDADFVNKAVTYMDDATLETEEVTDTYITKSPTYKYQSITEGMPLPDYISVTSGDYKIGDDTLYLNDVDVNRKNTVPTGTKYDIYYEDEVVASWELVKWDKDKATMTDDGVEFLGSWKFTVYKKPKPPVKSSVIKDSENETKEKVDSINDKITYTINQELGIGNKTVFFAYDSMKISDELPDELDYVSAIITETTNEGTLDITNNTTYGTLSYNVSTKKVEYVFNEDWLSNLENYKGQTFTLTIVTKVNGYTEDYKNKAITNIDDESLESNEVTDTYLTASPVYKYVSSDEEIELPEEINTTKGDYKVEDTNEYLNDEEVDRVNTVPTGTKFNIYNDNGDISAVWELINWDKDKAIMNSNDEPEFIGTWQITILSEPEPPVKTSKVFDENLENEKEKINSINDKISYTIDQKIGVFNKDVFKVYKSMEITDKLPDGLKYNTGKVYITINAETTEITDDNSYGSLSYDSSTNTVKYEFNSEWLKDKSNYTGETITLVINTDITNNANEYKNKATTYIDDTSIESETTDDEKELDSNETEDDTIVKTPKYLYMSIDENMPLPDEINSLRGSYKITDNSEYLNDEKVIRNDDIKVGSIYNVYDENNNLVGTWELVEWDKDSDIMSEDNVEFLGYWKYTKAPANPKTGDNLYIFVILNLLSLAIISFIGIKSYKQKRIS